MVGDVLHLQRIAQVRLVGAVFAERLRKGNARPALGHRLALGEFLEHAGDHRLHRRKHILLRDEAHLDVELVEFRQAVRAGVLVTEARRDLEVAVEARHHEQLLVLLRGLRQRVELAGMDAAGHQEVARALRRRGREDRRLEFKEPLLFHALAHGIDDGATRHDVLVEPVATQVEETVLKPYIFRIFLISEDRKRQFAGLTEHLDFGDVDFHCAGRQFRIFGAGGAAAHLAVDPHDPFGAQLLGHRERRGVRVRNALRQAVMIAQVDEQHAAMVADAVAPAGQPGDLIDVALAERAAGVGPIAMHDNPEARLGLDSAVPRGRGRRQGLPEPIPRGNRWPRSNRPTAEGFINQTLTQGGHDCGECPVGMSFDPPGDLAMLAKRSISSKLVVVVSFLLLVTAALGGFSYWQMRAINTAAQDIQTSWLPSVRWIGEMRVQSARYRAVLRDHLLATEPAQRADIDKNLAARKSDYEKAATQYEPLISSPAERDLADELKKLWPEFIGAAALVQSAANAGDLAGAKDLNAKKVVPTGRAMDGVLTKLTELNDRGAETAGRAANAAYGDAVRMMLAILALALLSGACAAIYLVRDIKLGIASILAPMSALAAAVAIREDQYLERERRGET